MKLSLRYKFRKGQSEKEKALAIRPSSSSETEIEIQFKAENKKSLTFSNLPPELRLKVWNILLSEPQFVEPKILYPRLHPAYKASSKATKPDLSFVQPPFRSWVARKGPPLLLSICSESRAEALRYYECYFTDEERTSSKWIYFNPAIDVLFYDHPTTSLHTSPNCQHFFEVASDVPRIRALAIALPWETWHRAADVPVPFHIARLLRYFLWRCAEPRTLIWALKHGREDIDAGALVEVARREKCLVKRGAAVLPSAEARVLADVRVDVAYMLDWPESPVKGCGFPCCADGAVACSWDRLRDSSMGDLGGNSINTLQI